MTSVRISDQMLNLASLNLGLREALKAFLIQNPSHFSFAFSFQEEESCLQKLNLSDCKLKTDINNMINALGSNQCLQVQNEGFSVLRAFLL